MSHTQSQSVVLASQKHVYPKQILIWALGLILLAFSASNAFAVLPSGGCPTCEPEPGDPSINRLPNDALETSTGSSTIPSVVTAGQTYNVTVKMLNSGNLTWTTATGYKLGSQNSQDNLTWGINRIPLSASVTRPGTAIFNFAITAPSTPGTYNFQWQMIQGSTWFGKPTLNKAVTVVASNVIGNVDGLVSNGTQLAGWACSTRLDQSIAVQLYIGGPSGDGVLYATYQANQTSEPAIAQSCIANGTAYRFIIPITADMRTNFGGQTIYVHGVSPVGQPNNLLGNSGLSWVPPLSSAIPSPPAPSATTLVNTRAYVYDTAERLCKRIEPETGASIIDYDLAGNLAWSTQGSTLTGNTCDRASVPIADRTIRSYNTMNRLVTTDVAGSLNDLSYDYYADGALKSLINNNNRWDYTYNRLRLPVSETLTIDGRVKTLMHSYDGLAQESSLTYPSGLVVTSNPNALGQASQAGIFATGVSYHANGGMSGFTYGNGIVHSLTQNQRQLPLLSKDMDGTIAILHDTYVFDANSNVTSITDGTAGHGGNRSMLYDAANRLTKTTALNQWWIDNVISYDVLDNIRVNTLGNRTYNYQYSATTQRLDQLTLPDASVARNLAYDATGNVITNGSQSYVFDKANRMEAVTGKENYEYDGHGRRVKITRFVGKLTSYPMYSLDGKLITEDDSRNGKATDYIYLNGSLVAKRSAPIDTTTYATTYLHTDSLGSPVAESDAAKTVTRIERYTPYGEPSDQGYDQGPGYTGHVTDAATGLTYAQQRYYDPVIGRFLSADPMPSDMNNGWNFNRYNYAANNPYLFTDPDGRECVGSNIKTSGGACSSAGESNPSSSATKTNTTGTLGSRIGAAGSALFPVGTAQAVNSNKTKDKEEAKEGISWAKKGVKAIKYLKAYFKQRQSPGARSFTRVGGVVINAELAALDPDVHAGISAAVINKKLSDCENAGVCGVPEDAITVKTYLREGNYKAIDEFFKERKF